VKLDCEPGSPQLTRHCRGVISSFLKFAHSGVLIVTQYQSKPFGMCRQRKAHTSQEQNYKFLQFSEHKNHMENSGWIVLLQ
jgi:hypothetical protein